MIKGWLRMTNRLVMTLLLGLGILSCGGGGGSDGGSGFVPAAEPEGADISISITDVDGKAITEISPLQPGRFTIKVKAPNGNPVVQEVVTASTTIGRLAPESGTALTNSNGEALLVVKADNVEGAGTFTAEVTFDEVTSSGSVSFSITADLPFSLGYELVNAQGEIVTSAVTGERLTLNVSLIDDRDNSPVQNQVISAGIGDLGTLAPASGNTVTGIDGTASFVIAVGNQSGAFPISLSAFVPGGSETREFTLSVDQAERKLGHIDSAGNFVDGVIKVDPAGRISAGGTATLSFAVVDADLNPVMTEERLNITSSCLFGNLSELDPASPVTLGSSASVSYTATSCSGEDLVVATLESSGAEASAVVEITPISAEKISFESASPTLIALRGTGSASDISESSNVSFKVTDGAGNPVVNARVNFSLVQSVGGLALECKESDFCSYADSDDASLGRSSRDSDRSNPSGISTTRVLSGSVASPVQVLAYVDLNEDGERNTNEPATTSKTLVVSTGLPDQNSISLSATTLNIEGAFERDGETSTLTVRMADKFNNPVPDGTSAIFSTELGSIMGSCNVLNGGCSVKWTSQAPRTSDTVDRYSAAITINENLDSSLPNRYRCPSHRENHGPCPDDIGDATVNPPGAPRGGRTTILVTANGEESFVDRNSNGVYDQGEYWTNLTEAFNDHNEDGLYTPSQRPNCLDPASADDVCLAGFEETFVDLNSNGLFDLNDQPAATSGSSLPNGLYNGVLCSLENDAAGICSRELLNVRKSIVLVNSFSNADNFDLMLISKSSKAEPGVLYENVFYNLYVSDLFNNPPPPGSKITFEASGDCEAVTETQPVPDSNKAGAFSSLLVVSTDDFAQTMEEADASEPDLIKIKLTLPNGSFTTETYACYVERCATDPSGFSPQPPACPTT